LENNPLPETIFYEELISLPFNQRILMDQRGKWVGGWAKQVMGIKEDTYDEHRVSHASDEPLNSTLETNIALYVN